TVRTLRLGAAVLYEAVQDVPVLGAGASQHPAAGAEALLDHQTVELGPRPVPHRLRLGLGDPRRDTLEHVVDRLVAGLEVLAPRYLDGMLTEGPGLGTRGLGAGRRTIAHGLTSPLEPSGRNVGRLERQAKRLPSPAQNVAG